MPSLTTAEAAAILGLTRRRVLALIRAGLLKAEKPGRDWVVDRDSVERLKKIDRPRGRPIARKDTDTNTDVHDQSEERGDTSQ
jgi:excisionase family DNA binding protein